MDKFVSQTRCFRLATFLFGLSTTFSNHIGSACQTTSDRGKNSSGLVIKAAKGKTKGKY